MREREQKNDLCSLGSTSGENNTSDAHDSVSFSSKPLDFSPTNLTVFLSHSTPLVNPRSFVLCVRHITHTCTNLIDDK